MGGVVYPDGRLAVAQGTLLWLLVKFGSCSQTSPWERPSLFALAFDIGYDDHEAAFKKQEAFEKCWAHSPLRAAARPFTRCRYCRKPPLSHAACASMSTTTTTTTRDRGDRYGPIEWAQLNVSGKRNRKDVNARVAGPGPRCHICITMSPKIRMFCHASPCKIWLGCISWLATES